MTMTPTGHTGLPSRSSGRPVTAWNPRHGAVEFITRPTLLLVLSGRGRMEIDFRDERHGPGKAVFLAPGQYIRFPAGDGEFLRAVFENERTAWEGDHRVLFRHLFAVGHVDFRGAWARLRDCLFQGDPVGALDLSADRWFDQDPFRASREEYDLIFDLKERIDDTWHGPAEVDLLATSLGRARAALDRVVKARLGITVKGLVLAKRLVEMKREVAFSPYTVQEIAYRQGFRDPSYFGRFFRQRTGSSPGDFRRRHGYPRPGGFAEELIALIDAHHAEHHLSSWYADRMRMSYAAFARRVKTSFGKSPGELIRDALMRHARFLLRDTGRPVRDVAFALGFDEAHRFSSFFRRYEGRSPSSYRAD